MADTARQPVHTSDLAQKVQGLVESLPTYTHSQTRDICTTQGPKIQMYSLSLDRETNPGYIKGLFMSWQHSPIGVKVAVNSDTYCSNVAKEHTLSLSLVKYRA